MAVLPPWILLDPLLRSWLREDIGRGDRTAAYISCMTKNSVQEALWMAKASGIVAGLPVASRIFDLLDSNIQFDALVEEGDCCKPGQVVARIFGAPDILLLGERVALNVAMRLSGIATLTRQYVNKISDLPVEIVDTRKTTPGLRLLEKYATQVGGARNHRLGLDDAVMIKDNHIAAAGSIEKMLSTIRTQIPYVLNIEVETETLAQVEEALKYGADIIMLDNMPLNCMRQAVERIRKKNQGIKIEASGNITLETLRTVAETGVDYISTSAPITEGAWLDLSMKFKL